MRDFLVFGAGLVLGFAISAFIVVETPACAQSVKVENGVTVIRGNVTKDENRQDATTVIRGNELNAESVTTENGVTVIRGDKANSDYVTEENGVTVIRGDKK